MTPGPSFSCLKDSSTDRHEQRATYISVVDNHTEVKAYEINDAQRHIQGTDYPDGTDHLLTDEDKRLYNRLLTAVANGIGKDWMSLGRTLEMSEATLQSVSCQYNSYGIKEMAQQMLITWQRQVTPETMITTLLQKLEEVGRMDMVDCTLKILEDYAESSSFSDTENQTKMKTIVNNWQPVIKPEINLIPNTPSEYDVALGSRSRTPMNTSTEELSELKLVSRSSSVSDIFSGSGIRTPLNLSTEELAGRLISKKILKAVAEDIAADSMILGRALGVPESKLAAISKNHVTVGVKEMLKTWQQSASSRATTEVLAANLKAVGKKDLSDQVLKMASNQSERQLVSQTERPSIANSKSVSCYSSKSDMVSRSRNTLSLMSTGDESTDEDSASEDWAGIGMLGMKKMYSPFNSETNVGPLTLDLGVKSFVILMEETEV